MRHHDRNRKLGREKRQRTALLRSLARSLVISGSIVTTEAKAKALRPFVERLITEDKKNNLSSAKEISRHFGLDIRKKLHEIASQHEKRAGGHTRIVRLGRVGKRVGEMARIEFVK